jgi:hypothetical protein
MTREAARKAGACGYVLKVNLLAIRELAFSRSIGRPVNDSLESWISCLIPGAINLTRMAQPQILIISMTYKNRKATANSPRTAIVAPFVLVALTRAE